MSQQNAKPAPDMRILASQSGKRTTTRESDWIGRKLNQVYNQTLAEPLPAEFMALIDAIGQRERNEDPSNR